MKSGMKDIVMCLSIEDSIHHELLAGHVSERMPPSFVVVIIRPATSLPVRLDVSNC